MAIWPFLFGLGRFISLLILYTAGRTPWTGDQTVGMPLPTHRTAQTQNKRIQTSMPRVGFEPTIPAFVRAKMVHALDRAATVIGEGKILLGLNKLSTTWRCMGWRYISTILYFATWCRCSLMLPLYSKGTVHCTHYRGGWVDPTTSADLRESCPTGNRTPLLGLPAGSLFVIQTELSRFSWSQ
jgi:hypothetical protein